MKETLIDIWYAAGWLLRRLACALAGHRWPPTWRGSISVWDRCLRCDLYRFRQWWDRREDPPPFEFGRGKLPRCGHPAVNPWKTWPPAGDSVQREDTP